MYPDHYLPALTTELPQQLRVDYARSDLRIIAAQSQMQVAVHEHATDAATNILREVASIEIPNRDRLAELTKQYELSDSGTQLTPGQAVSQMVLSSEHSRIGVRDRDITRDLHPDRAVSEEDNGIAETLFKSVTEARRNEDVTLIQGLYAGAVASRAAAVEGPSPSSLEMTRYKAWLALQAGKGRFSSHEEVEAWREREVELLPVRVRAGLLISARDLFGKALGADADGSVALPMGIHQPVARGLDSSASAIEKVMGDGFTTSDMAKVDTELFDQRMGKLINQLDVMLGSQSDISASWSYLKGQRAADFARGLSSIARVLQGFGREDELALGSIGLHIRTKKGYGYPDSREDRYPSNNGFQEGDFLRSIIRKRTYKNEESIFKDKYNEY